MTLTIIFILSAGLGTALACAFFSIKRVNELTQEMLEDRIWRTQRLKQLNEMLGEHIPDDDPSIDAAIYKVAMKQKKEADNLAADVDALKARVKTVDDIESKAIGI